MFYSGEAGSKGNDRARATSIRDWVDVAQPFLCLDTRPPMKMLIGCNHGHSEHHLLNILKTRIFTFDIHQTVYQISKCSNPGL